MNATKLAHIHDPQVSHDAALTVSGGTASEQVMHAVIEMLTDRGPSTPDELSDTYYRTRDLHPELDWPLVKLHSVNKRVSEMKKHVGVLRAVGRQDGCELLDLADDRQSAHADVTDYWKKGR